MSFGTCIDGYRMFHSFLPTTFSTSRRECSRVGGELAFPSGAGFSSAALERVHMEIGSSYPFWIDLSHRGVPESFSEMAYLNGESQGTSPQCLVLTHGGTLEPSECTEEHNFICSILCEEEADAGRNRDLQEIAFSGCQVNQELYFNPVKKTQSEANLDCASFGGSSGRLAIPNSFERLEAIVNFSSGNGFGGSRWLGFQDFNELGGEDAKRFTAINGQQNPFTHIGKAFPWKSDQPNDSGGRENCGEIIGENTLNDLSCTQVRTSVCERYCGVVPEFVFGECVDNIEYYFNNQKRSFSAAQADCETQHPEGTLAVPSDLATFSRIQSLFLANKPSNIPCWVGLRDFTDVGGLNTSRFLDINGDLQEFTNVAIGDFPWNSGNPNNLEDNQNCVDLDPFSGLLNDRNCRDFVFSVCQKPCDLNLPTTSPSQSPSKSPSKRPTSSPSSTPTDSPTNNPTSAPSFSPTTSPTFSPTLSPSSTPTQLPTDDPTSNPTPFPTLNPTFTGQLPDAAACGSFVFGFKNPLPADSDTE